MSDRALSKALEARNEPADMTKANFSLAMEVHQRRSIEAHIARSLGLLSLDQLLSVREHIENIRTRG